MITDKEKILNLESALKSISNKEFEQRKVIKELYNENQDLKNKNKQFNETREPLTEDRCNCNKCKNDY